MTISNVILRLDIRTEYKHFETQIEQKIKNIEAEQKLFGSNEKKEYIFTEGKARTKYFLYYFAKQRRVQTTRCHQPYLM